jgi:hypothetical protein
MSTTTSPSAPIVSPSICTQPPPPTVRDQIIADAKSLPDLIQKASVLDPTLAAVLTGQATTASKTPIGAALAAGVAWLASHYGLGWGEGFDNTIAGLAIVGGGYAAHWWQARNAPLGVTKLPK